jgi:hypothetical protein
MKLILGMMSLAVAAGYLAGGRLGNFANLKIRWLPMALVGLLLQLIALPGGWPLLLLVASFVLLFAFCVANIRVAGFALILIGVVLNFAVIAVNHGMPVSEAALRGSGQMDTMSELIRSGGAKHHMARSDDTLLFLGDVLAVPQPIGQAISVGDIFTYGGVAILIAMGMRPSRALDLPVEMEAIPITGDAAPTTSTEAHGVEAHRGAG